MSCVSHAIKFVASLQSSERMPSTGAHSIISLQAIIDQDSLTHWDLLHLRLLGACVFAETGTQTPLTIIDLKSSPKVGANVQGHEQRHSKTLIAGAGVQPKPYFCED